MSKFIDGGVYTGQSLKEAFGTSAEAFGSGMRTARQIEKSNPGIYFNLAGMVTTANPENIVSTAPATPAGATTTAKKPKNFSIPTPGK